MSPLGPVLWTYSLTVGEGGFHEVHGSNLRPLGSSDLRTYLRNL